MAEAKRRAGREMGWVWGMAGIRRSRHARWWPWSRAEVKQDGHEGWQAWGEGGIQGEASMRWGSCEAKVAWGKIRQRQVGCSRHEAGVLPRPTKNGTSWGTEGLPTPAGARGERPRRRVDIGRKRRGKKGGGVGEEPGGRWDPRGAKSGTSGPAARCLPPVGGGRSLVAGLRPPQRDARKSPLNCGSRREGLRQSQPGSEWQRGKGRPPPPPPPLLLSRGRAGGRRAAPHPTPVSGRRRGGRGSPERMQQAGGPAEGSAAAARSPAGSGGPPGPAAATSLLLPPPPHPAPTPAASLPLFPSPRGFSELKTVGDAELWSGIRPVGGAGPDQGELLGGGAGSPLSGPSGAQGDTGGFVPHRHSNEAGTALEGWAQGGSGGWRSLAGLSELSPLSAGRAEGGSGMQR